MQCKKTDLSVLVQICFINHIFLFHRITDKYDTDKYDKDKYGTHMAPEIYYTQHHTINDDCLKRIDKDDYDKLINKMHRFA